MPAVFAFADKVIANTQTATFAAFGSFAMLVLVEFTGRPRSRLTAYLALGLVGAVLVVLGTLCSRNAWLAAAAMLIVGFLILILVIGSMMAVFLGALEGTLRQLAPYS